MDMEVKIACKGATTVSLDEMLDLQGDLKTLSEDDYVKLRNSITEFGFSFPEFYWEDTEGKKWTIDAHQRNRTLRKMRDEGWTIPPLPADPIFAKDKTEAKKKLLLQISRYGKLSDTGLADFVNEADSSFAIDEISDFLEFPELNFSPHEYAPMEKNPNDEQEKMICPNCQVEIILVKA